MSTTQLKQEKGVLNKTKIEDIKAELKALQQQDANNYWPQWEKDRDINILLDELNRELSR